MFVKLARNGLQLGDVACILPSAKQYYFRVV